MEADRLQATGWIWKANRVRMRPRRCSSSRFGCLILNGFLCYSASWNTAVITQILNPELTKLTVVDLHPAKTYNLRMFATNSVGTSHSSSVLTITTKEAGRAESHTQLFFVQEDSHLRFILLDVMRPQHPTVLLWTCGWRASLLTASESHGRSVTHVTLHSLLMLCLSLHGSSQGVCFCPH